MLQRILGAVLVIAGLAAIAFGVATATVLRESDTVVATARPVGDGTLVVTDPGVLDLVDSDVTVTASVPEGQEVTVVVGRDVDVLGWLEGDPYTRATGLQDWDTLTTSEVLPEEPEEAEEAETAEGEEPEEVVLPDPAGSDMWITELTAAEQVSLRWNDRPGPWVLLAAGTGAAPVEEEAEAAEGEEPPAEVSDADAVAPTLELSWDREVGTPWLWPGVGVGGLLLLLGIVLLLLGRRRKKPGRGRRASGGDAAGAAAATPGTASSAPAGDSPDDPASPESPASPAAPASPFGSTVSSPVPAPADQASTEAPEQGTAEQLSAEGLGENRTGTAPVPVAGRFSRRSSRLRRTRSAPEPAAEDGAQPDAAPASPPMPTEPSMPTEPPTTTTGSLPMLDGRPLTRRELRRREEERRAGAQSGVGRAFRALTGQTPVVPPAPATPPAADDPPPTSGRRAAAWRETWGFDTTAAVPDEQHDDHTDGRTR